jgi:4-hydroxybutyrate---CoA ligase (ADP-forming)
MSLSENNKINAINAIVDNLQRLSQLISDFHEIEEFDINPLMVLEEGKEAFTVDVRIGLRRMVTAYHHKYDNV